MINKFIPVNTPLLNNDDAKAVYDAVKTGWISSEGPQVKEFEKKTSKWVNRKFASCVSSGTAALEIAIKSLKFNKGDEVIMPAFTIISNANAIIKSNLKPVLVDINLDTWNMNIQQIEKKITKKTKCLMVPHIYGFPNEMDKIAKIAKKFNLYTIEDAAEMIGSKYKDKLCGSFGDISIFSFYANKHITTGEGGMILTNNKAIDKRVKEFRNLSFGKIDRFNHQDISWNYRFTNIQAALGLSQLKRINKIVDKKFKIGNFYYNKLKNNKKIIIQPPKLKYAKNIYWVFGVIVKRNYKLSIDQIRKKLLKLNIQTRPFFWPIHQQDAYRGKKLFNKKDKFPITEFVSKNGFYLPSGLGVSFKELEYVTRSINQIIK